MTINKWCIIRSGFLQYTGKEGNGCTPIFGKLAEKWGGNGNRIELGAWNDDPAHMVETIMELSDPKKLEVVIMAYSWGCGYGAIQLAKELDKKGFEVKCMVLCDPVKHCWWAIWRAAFNLIPWIKIKIPPNVKEVYWLRQYKNKPRGHNLKAMGALTVIHPPEILELKHDQMDNSEEFFRSCRRVAFQLFNEEK